MQKNGAGLHTASSCFWDSTTDGKGVGMGVSLGPIPLQTLGWLVCHCPHVPCLPCPCTTGGACLGGSCVQCPHTLSSPYLYPISPHRELHGAMGEQDHVLHRQRLWTLHLSRSPPDPLPSVFLSCLHLTPQSPATQHLFSPVIARWGAPNVVQYTRCAAY